tara:strand:- start:1212 stop:1778 length:567 start_codon:yes stop_codon:yes gene_type:complete
MAVNVKIVSKLEPKAKPVTVTVKGPKIEVVEYKLDMRRTLSGDIMIFDHKEIDIIILVEKKKVVAFAKDSVSEITYGAEKRLFDYLKRKGIIQFDSIEGGSLHGSLQGMLLESKEVDNIKITLYEVSQWLQSEKPFLEDEYQEVVDDYLLHPDEEMSTDLGEVPHEEEKGSILQRGLFAPYLYGKYTY